MIELQVLLTIIVTIVFLMVCMIDILVYTMEGKSSLDFLWKFLDINSQIKKYEQI